MEERNGDLILWRYGREKEWGDDGENDEMRKGKWGKNFEDEKKWDRWLREGWISCIMRRMVKIYKWGRG